MSEHNVVRRQSAYDNLREASEMLTNGGYVAVRTSDLGVVLDLLLDVYPKLGDPTVSPAATFNRPAAQ